MKKILVLLLIFVLTFFAFAGCDGVGTPAEGEGEGEGEEEPEPAKQVVLVEAFLSATCPGCAQVKPILEQLADEYDRDEMILVEVAPWGSCSTTEAKERYNWYAFSGVPQTLFNGTSIISGTSSYSTLKSRIEGKLTLTPKISIQVTKSVNGNTTNISGSIKNISSSDLSNLVINGMAIKNCGSFAYTAIDIFEEDKTTVSSLAAGETKEFEMTLEGIDLGSLQTDGVIFVQSGSSMKNIYQSLFIE